MISRVGLFCVVGLMLATVASAAAVTPAVSSAAAESIPVETRIDVGARAGDRGNRDAAAMLLIGTALIGLATVVRRAA